MQGSSGLHFHVRAFFFAVTAESQIRPKRPSSALPFFGSQFRSQPGGQTLYCTACSSLHSVLHSVQFFTVEPSGQVAGPRSQRVQARVHSCSAGRLHHPQHARCDEKFIFDAPVSKEKGSRAGTGSPHHMPCGVHSYSATGWHILIYPTEENLARKQPLLTTLVRQRPSYFGDQTKTFTRGPVA